jgi:hypothetical protein
MGILVAAAALLPLFLRPSADRNPYYFLYNSQSNKLEIYNKGNDMLWFIPSKGIRQSEEDDLQSGYTHVLVTNINGDGKNEVISIVPLAGEDSPLWDALRIYSQDGQTVATTRLSHAIRYQGKSYPSSTQLGCVYADRFGSSDEKLIVVEGQTGRSPMVICVANGRGELQGEYWHFGNLPLSKKMTDSLTHRPLLVLTGSNDCDDEKDEAYPVVVVLDPGAISGQTESRLTRGFGYAASSSEVFYIRLPRPELEVEMHYKPRIQGLGIRESEGRNVIQISSGGPAGNSSRPLFEYTFNDSFRILTVTTDDPTRQLFHQLRASGKTNKYVDEAYLRELGSNVRYWNGTDWTKEVTRLRP